VNNKNMEAKIVPLFKRFEELQQDQIEIQERFEAEWEAAYVARDAALAEIEIRKDAISKLASAPPAIPARPLSEALRKAAATPELAALIDATAELEANMAEANARLQALKFNREIRDALLDADVQLIAGLNAAIKKRDEAIFGVGENARRSARFARVHSRGYRGPAATITQIGARK